MLQVISKVDPKKTVEIGGYHLDVGRNDRKKTVQLSKSETYLTDLMETICKSHTYFDMFDRIELIGTHIGCGFILHQVIN